MGNAADPWVGTGAGPITQVGCGSLGRKEIAPEMKGKVVYGESLRLWEERGDRGRGCREKRGTKMGPLQRQVLGNKARKPHFSFFSFLSDRVFQHVI